MKKHHAHHEEHKKHHGHHEEHKKHHSHHAHHEHASHHASHHSHKSHPHHRGAGMPYFEAEHWQKPVGDVMSANEKYSSGEMSQGEDYKRSVDALAHYARTHREKH